MADQHIGHDGCGHYEVRRHAIEVVTTQEVPHG
jgi:hypothetical protein